MLHVAQQLAAQGRNGDTELVHMSRGEVAGLHALAKRAGTGLTRNPKTGLPEAFNLASLLPIAVGFIPGIGPMAAMAIGAGIGAMANKQSPLMGAISGGLGAYGGGNLAGALGGAGETALATQAADASATAAMQAPAADLAASGMTASDAAMAAAPQTAVPASIPPEFATQIPADTTMNVAASPQGAFRSGELAYQNTVTGGSSNWDKAMAGAKDAPLGQKISAIDSSQLGNMINAQNAKNIAMPIYGSMMLQPPDLKTGGGDNGSRYQGELWWDQRTPVPGLPKGIQRSRIKGYAAGGRPTVVGQYAGLSRPMNMAQVLMAQMSRPPMPQLPPQAQGLPGMRVTRPFQQMASTQPAIKRINQQPAIDAVNAEIAAAQAAANAGPPNGMTWGEYLNAGTGAAGDGPGSGPGVGDGNGSAGGDGFSHGGLMGLGQYLRGPGDGMSDDIPAIVHDSGQQIRVASNEYVVPADVVSHLGNGSSDAGAKVLDAMGARVRKARTGNPAQGRQINPAKFTPA